VPILAVATVQGGKHDLGLADGLKAQHVGNLLDRDRLHVMAQFAQG
jgi:hypothetical protein